MPSYSHVTKIEKGIKVNTIPFEVNGKKLFKHFSIALMINEI